MKISLIIAFYKNIAALELIFKALEKQTFKNFEIIIAEDDNNLKTIEFIKKSKLNQIIKHVFHEDKGFRKNKILNEGIKIADGDFIVFIDGDCIPHKNFLKVYAKMASEETVLFGRRVMLSEKMTMELYSTRQLSLLSFLQ
jgi:glycosyltransferase involved in cell wall biosynthesis